MTDTTYSGRTQQQPVAVASGVGRRAVLGGISAALASAVLARPARALPDAPPAFGNSRHQFTILQPARMVPPIPITRLDGRVATFAAFLGKVVLVNFWATWCPACRTELPLLDRLQESAGRKDLQVVAISMDRDGRAKVAPFVRGLNLRHLDIYLDPEGRIVRAADDDNPAVPFGRFGMPISYVIDRDGRIAGYVAGEADWTTEAARRLLDYYATRGSG
jgi:thiol-disulfide isomerase/thioredoxin